MEKIELTKEEVEEIKDTARFREKVVLQLKQLNGLPNRVKTVEIKMLMLMWGIPVVVGLLFTVLRVWAK